MTKKTWLNNLIFVVVMAVALAALWWISALIVDTPLVLPSVPAVWHELCVIGSDVSFYAQLGLTLLRSLVAFLLSFAVALVLALVANLFPVKRPINAVVALLRALPTMSIIFICVVAFPTRVIASLVAFLVGFPVMYAAFDLKLTQSQPITDMLNVFAVRKLDRVLFAYLPTLAEDMVAQCRSTFALVVKVCIAGEALALPREGVGVEMYIAKVNMDTAALFAWTIAALVVCYAVDGLIVLACHICKRVKGGKQAENEQRHPKPTLDNLPDALPDTTPTDITLEGVGVTYDDGRTVYDNLFVTFAAGKVHAILGPSGCGKTTLLNVVGGLVAHTGKADGCDGGCSYVFQDARLIPQSVLANVELVLRRSIRDKAKRRATALYVLALANIDDCAYRNATTLSGGEQQRVALARAFAYGGATLLADEPLKSLDLRVKRKLYQTLDELLAVSPRTVLYVTHDVEEALALADEVYVADGSPCVLNHVATIAEPRGGRDLYSEQSVELRKRLEKLL